MCGRALFRFPRIELDVALPVRRYMLFIVDRFDGAFHNARAAVDAFIRIDVKHQFVFVKAFHRAHDYARLIFAANAGLGNYHCHLLSPLKWCCPVMLATGRCAGGLAHTGEVRKRSGIRTVVDEKNSESFQTLATLPDAELLRQWKRGNEHAVRLLLDRYSVRLVALVATRLNQRFRESIDPDDVVQSALGSFFFAAQQSRFATSDNTPLWRLLATFARRKLARAIERQSAQKRGGKLQRRGEQAVELLFETSSVSERDAEQLMQDLAAELPSDLFLVLQRLLAGETHQEVAAALCINERTVRRRITRIGQALGGGETSSELLTRQPAPQPLTFHSQSLPQVHYREFVLGKLIGSGGFGKVYRASMQQGGQRVAVKFLRKSLWQHSAARATFLREIEAASQIDHPGVIKYLGWGQSPHGGPYVLAQWIDGTSLLEHRHATVSEFVEILSRVCRALAAVHEAGLVHGDLTPGNLLIDQSGNAILTDFGLASVAAVDQAAGLHGGGSATGDEPAPRCTPLGGTLGFAAPEQLSLAFGEITAACDIYAIGGLIRWFLQGRTSGATAALQATPVMDNSDTAQAPGALAELADACLQVHPGSRPRSAAIILSHLNRL